MRARIAALGTFSLTAALALACAMVAPARAQSPGLVTRVSVDSLGAQANGASDEPAISADGRFVAFVSDATNLVPGDTNDNTDVFVRDQETGVVERVSLTWNGMESRDDSFCPAISADGRYVAFLSRGWNMYDGGANLGHPRNDVYVRDRQEGTTRWLSVAHDGGDPDNESLCPPTISADGSKIAFASFAENLVEPDENFFADVFVVDRESGATTRASVAMDGGETNGSSAEPALSADGKLVAFSTDAPNVLDDVQLPPTTYGGSGRFQGRIVLRDLEAGTNELVSAAVDHKVAVDGRSQNSSISADGRYVAFESFATNLVFPFVNLGLERRSNVFVRDRQTGTTVLLSPWDVAMTDCGREDLDFPCTGGDSTDPAISADGRFVAYVSRSLWLLPANFWHGTQIYVYDLESTRIRRLSVDATGREGDKCSAHPALSSDGTILVYRSTSTDLVPEDTNGTCESEFDRHCGADVFRHDWTCSASGSCREIAACPPEPMHCAAADRAVLRVFKRPPGQLIGDRLFWRWAAPIGESGASFPSPMEGASYQVCLYDGESKHLAIDVAVPEAGTCGDDGATPCWSAEPAVYRLSGGTEGVTKVTLRSGSDTKRILARGRGAMLDLPHLPVDSGSGVLVQLQEIGTGRCWGSFFGYRDVKRNVGGSAETMGRLVAKMD